MKTQHFLSRPLLVNCDVILWNFPCRNSAAGTHHTTSAQILWKAKATNSWELVTYSPAPWGSCSSFGDLLVAMYQIQPFLHLQAISLLISFPPWHCWGFLWFTVLVHRRGGGEGRQLLASALVPAPGARRLFGAAGLLDISLGGDGWGEMHRTQGTLNMF